MLLPVSAKDRLEGFLRPKLGRANFPQAGSVPIGSSAPASRDGVDVVRFRINVNRRRIVLQHREDLPGVRWRPTGAAVAAAAGVLHQLSNRNVTVMVRVLAVRTFSHTYSCQHLGGVPTDCALPGVCGLAFAVKLHERAEENRVFSP